MLRFRKPVALALLAVLTAAAGTAQAAPSTDELKVIADTLWVLIAGFLVFFMNTGFGCVEAGFCRAKNAVNILGKNFVVFAIASLSFWLVGWAFMFGDGNKFMGTTGWMVTGEDNSPASQTLEAQLFADVKDKYKVEKKVGDKVEVEYPVDLGDEKFKSDPANKALVAQVDDILGKSTTKADIEKLATKVKEGDAEIDAVVVKLSVPGQQQPFEKAYPVSSIYYGVYGSISWATIPLMAKFFFQLVFAATAATIVSGCVAERIHYGSFMVFSVFIVAFSYPVTGHWIWGGGWLGADWGFWDFAGSTVVHSVGGWAGLAGILLLGPRLGKYKPDGTIQPIPGHSMALAFLGGLILWLGWFGFNPGSTMAADIGGITRVVITTNLACAAGMLAATGLAWCMMGKPDFSMTVNGALAGLVAITAPCFWVDNVSAVIIGGIGGVLVVLAVFFFDRIRIDDPVGALSVHLVNGIWGTLSIGLFANPAVGFTSGEAAPNAGLLFGGGTQQLVSQVVGVAAVGVFTFAGSLVVWGIIKAVIGLRVEEHVEIEGLDVHEMGMEAYPGFQFTDPVEYAHATSEPRPAKLPPGGKRFSVVVDGIGNGELLSAWSEMCQPGKAKDLEAFKAVYPYMTTVQGNRFTFRGGDPNSIKANLQKLFAGLNKTFTVQVQ